MRESDRYHRVYARKLAALHASAATPPRPPPRPARRTRRAPSPAIVNADAGPSCPESHFENSWDPKFDAPGPAHELLVGGDVCIPGLDPASAALFWRSEVSRAEGLANAANRHLHFTRQMSTKAQACCLIETPSKSSRSKRIRTTGLDKGKERAQQEEEAPSRDKGKGRAAPMDEYKGAEGEDDDT